jgi:3-oxoacyl-[acyl-carrier protein] reductase
VNHSIADQDALLIGADAIGAGIAARLAREGARVTLLDDDPERATRVAASLPGTAGTAIACDLSDPEVTGRIVHDLVARLAALPVLVLNVLGEPHLAALEAHEDGAFVDSFAPVRAAAQAMRAAVPKLAASGRGRIVLVGHRYGLTVNEGLAAYNAAAWALIGLTRSAAAEWGRLNISTNLLVPFAKTPEFDGYRARRPRPIDTLLSQIPLRRAGDAEEDIGGAVMFLAGAGGAFINGEIVFADGGQHIAGPVLSPARFG